MTKQADPADAFAADEAANSPFDEETAPLPILDTGASRLDAEVILLGLGHQLEQLLALGRSIDARLEKLLLLRESEAKRRPAKSTKRSAKR